MRPTLNLRLPPPAILASATHSRPYFSAEDNWKPVRQRLRKSQMLTYCLFLGSFSSEWLEREKDSVLLPGLQLYTLV